jgi:hypothetical protein
VAEGFSGDPLGELWEVVIQSGKQIAEEIKEDARTRVSEAYPPASEPGTPPHRRSGNLMEGIYSVAAVDDGEKSVSIHCGTDVFYGVFLEQGTERMDPRPMWEGLQEDWEARAREILAENLAKRFGT